MAFHFPSFNEYQAALQHPTVCFEHFELKASQIEADLWGLPRVRSGGFALTYKLEGKNGRTWAVRCFHKFVSDRTSRYVTISQYLSNLGSDIFIPVRYLPKGIMVRGAWYPLTFMKWVEGDTLESYLVKHYRDPERITNLGREFLRVVAELERLKIAHGDLSHRNLMVRSTGSSSHITLIDYDGLFIPGLDGRKSCELGNIHFQHPGRNEAFFNPAIDRFSEIVIYLALQALAHNPDLWNRYETGGEGLLFQRSDFLKPATSRLLKELETYPDFGPLIANFRRICTQNITQIPTLQDFIQQQMPQPGLAGNYARSKATLYPTHRAADRLSLLRHLGQVVTVVGKATDVFNGASPEGKPHYFLNFGDWRSKCFTIVIWSEALDLLRTMKRDPQVYAGRWIRVTGLLTAYNRRPQIAIESPTDIEMLVDEAQAELRLQTPAGRAGGDIQVQTNIRPVKAPGAVKIQPARALALPNRKPIETGSLDVTPEIQAELEKLYAPLKYKNKPNTGE
jgi:hypothetical protein